MSDTYTQRADVFGRAHVLVIAVKDVWFEGASISRITAIISAGITIFTEQLIRARNARLAAACIPQCAGVSVIACKGVGPMSAALLKIAGVVRAGITVVAGQHFGGLAGSILAHRGNRTRVAVIAIQRIWGKDTPLPFLATVVGARVAVIAGQVSSSWLASPIDATIANRAGIRVGALKGVIHVDATLDGIACVRCAGVLIVTV
mgnify:CR=1 FL=1